MDIKAAFYSKVREHARYHISEFTTWPKLTQFVADDSDGEPTLVRPDGFVSIQQAQESGSIREHLFFLEVDRSTEVLDTIVRRISCYYDFYRSGGFALRHATAPDDYRKHPFRVFFVCKSRERIETIIQRLISANASMRTMALFATQEDVCSQPLSPIWTTVLDHLANTPDRPSSKRTALFG